MSRFPLTWRTVLYTVMGVIWLAIGIGRLERGESGFVPIAAVLTGLCWFVVAILWRPKSLR